MKGLVIRNTGYSYTVRADETGEIFDCKVKGNFRIRGIRTTNPVAIGDRVEFAPVEIHQKTLPSPPVKGGSIVTEIGEGTTRQTETHSLPLREGGGGSALITAIEDRKNYVIRKSTNLSKQSHIIAANVDMCFLIVTVTQPETSLTFIDRFLASAEAYRIPVTLVFNKVDIVAPLSAPHEGEDCLADSKEVDWVEYLDGVINLYENIGYTCLKVSAKTGEGIDELRNMLYGKISLFSGNSGVGKSTLINTLIPGLNLKTSEISDAYNTGKHTTTFSEMYDLETLPSPPVKGRRKITETSGDSASQIDTPPLPIREGWGGSLIDTPGIKGFGTFDMKREEVGHYFREIFHFSHDCRFNNCTHTHEPHCAVLEALERHDIAQSRYNSYLSMLEDEKEEKYRQGY